MTAVAVASPAPWSEEFAVVDGIRLRVRRRGHGPPLLLINGLGATLEMWQPFADQLTRREIVSFDLPGVGGSELARRPFRMAGLAGIVDGLLRVLGYERLDVLGYSLGGAVALELARRHPERIARLVLCATSPGTPSVPPHPLAGAFMLTPARYYDPWLAQLIVPVIAGGRTARDRRALEVDLSHRLTHPPNPLGYAMQLFAFAGWGSHRWVRQVPHPILVLHGDDDPLVPLVNARFLAWSIPHGTLRVVHGGGHLMLFDEPARVGGIVEDFLALSPVPTSP
jgi:poly(3-hydroxyalkanoate) depolymerase